jgi:hypothetical protein
MLQPETFPQAGGCHCGAVRYEILAAPSLVYACHCTDCQTETGSAFSMVALVPRAQFRITRGTPTNFNPEGAAVPAIIAWFCGDCATRLFHAPTGDAADAKVGVKAGTFDDTSWVRPTTHLWTRSKQSWVGIPEGATCFETQPGRAGS